MTDIHCHILPGLDDGAADMEQALEMARLACSSGVDTVVATPHCNLPHSENKNYRCSEAERAVVLFRRELELAGIDLRVLPGAEVLCTPQLPELLEQKLLPTLADSRYMLAEFFFDESPEYMDSMLKTIEQAGFIPVIAHPERYEALQIAPRIAQRWFHRGWVIQLNKGSILGRFGRRSKLCADWILSRGFAHAVASDAHSPELRTPHMGETEQYLIQNCSPEYADILLNINPRRIVEDLPLLPAD